MTQPIPSWRCRQTVHMAAHVVSQQSEGKGALSQPGPHRGRDLHQLPGVRGSSVRLPKGAPSPISHSDRGPAFTHSSAGEGYASLQGQRILWVWKPKWMPFVQLSSVPRANRQFKLISDSNCAGSPRSEQPYPLHSTPTRLAAWGWGLRDRKQRAGLL